eukprot:COSAG02_NODE_257_length_26838_cov_118.324844_1_plen_42_part_00
MKTEEKPPDEYEPTTARSAPMIDGVTNDVPPTARINGLDGG